MKTVIFAMPQNESMATRLAYGYGAELGKAEIRRFPDGETYIRVISNVKNKKAVVVCTLHKPDDKLLPLYFLSKTLRSQGADMICLVAPYLAYMRQDKIFKIGEGITSEYFATILSGIADVLITIDPHLHRISTLNKIYTIPSTVLHASDHISDWIKRNLNNAVLIGPDSESEQWVSVVAENANVPFTILEKIRKGDTEVKVSVPHIKRFRSSTPVLVDDIISTARTMIQAVSNLRKTGMRPPVCIGVHAIFAGNAFNDLMTAGAQRIVTCNTIQHQSNAIDISDLLQTALHGYCI